MTLDPILAPLGQNSNVFTAWTHFREAMNEKHERLGAVTSCDIVELDPIGRDILMATKTPVQQTIRRNCVINIGVLKYSSDNTLNLLKEVSAI